jgi:hypothetical protein
VSYWISRTLVVAKSVQPINASRSSIVSSNNNGKNGTNRRSVIFPQSCATILASIRRSRSSTGLPNRFEAWVSPSRLSSPTLPLPPEPRRTDEAVPARTPGLAGAGV